MLTTFGVLRGLVIVFAVVVPVRRARQLVASEKIVLAAKAIRDETGWDLAQVRDVVDAIRAEQAPAG